MKQCFVYKKFSADHRHWIDIANSILLEWRSRGFDMTLRQVYYQCVAHHGLPNTERSYKNLGNILVDARLAGEIDWNLMIDRTRGSKGNYHNEDVSEPLKGLDGSIYFERWEDQDVYVEVWVEKEALENIVNRACFPLDARFMACRGYLSISEFWKSAERFKQMCGDYGRGGKILYIGDHDPSGIDMSRDIQDRMNMFTESEPDSPLVEVNRIALNMDQIIQFGLPPNPAKVTDSRAGGYIDRFGEESWELDALDPTTITDLIQNALKADIDVDRWNARLDEEVEAKKKMKLFELRYDEIIQFFEDHPYEGEIDVRRPVYL